MSEVGTSALALDERCGDPVGFEKLKQHRCPGGAERARLGSAPGNDVLHTTIQIAREGNALLFAKSTAARTAHTHASNASMPRIAAIITSCALASWHSMPPGAPLESWRRRC